MGLIEDATQARDKTFQERVLVAVIIAAVNVSSEDPAADGYAYTYANYLRRVALATNVLNTPEAHRERWAWAVSANPSIVPSSPDGDIQWTVNSLWDAMAGVIKADPTPVEPTPPE